MPAKPARAVLSHADVRPGLLPLEAATRTEARAGFVVTSVTLKFRYANVAAFRILCFPHHSNEPAVVEQQLRAIIPAGELGTDALPEAAFISGRRQYTCRPFLLDGHSGQSRQPMLGFLLERSQQNEDAIGAIRGHFHLSPREFESVQHLVRGLTTKEVAACMRVSPNTVKQYVRVVMSKMGVTTRTGIVGKFLTG